MTLDDLIGWLKQIPWGFWFTLAVFPLSWYWLYEKRQAELLKERVAESWPIVEGRAWSTVGSGLSLGKDTQGYKACFTYSFSVVRNGETEYYSGNFSRIFSDGAIAQEWLRLVRSQEIPIRVNPADPSVSVALFTDLIAKFPLPIPAILEGELQDPTANPKQPHVLRWPTEMVALLVALGFCLSLVDHLLRVLADAPLYPKLAPTLWIGFAVVVIPFEIWFYQKSKTPSFKLRVPQAKRPSNRRLAVYALNLYAFFYPLITGTHFVEYYNLHWNMRRFDPLTNGAFLTILLGNFAAFLYGRLENIEDSPSYPASITPRD